MRIFSGNKKNAPAPAGGDQTRKAKIMATRFKYEKKNNVGFVTCFEENERRPCTLDWDSIRMLEEIIKEMGADPEIRAAVLRSDSPKSFIVGANIAVLETLNAENIIDWVKNGHRVFGMFQKLPFPVIAVVESYALGGGLELAMSCDMILATENARFAQPEASLGVMPGWGGSYRLANLIGLNRAKEMFYTGEHITARQGYEWGLVNHVYADKDSLEQGLAGILDGIAKNDARVLHLTKEIINSHFQNGTEDNALEEAYTSSVCMNSESTKKRLGDFFASRKK